MAQTMRIRVREKVDHGHMLEQRARMWERWARPHWMAQNEMHIQKEGSPTLFGHPPPLSLSFTPFCPLSSLFLAIIWLSLHERNLRCSSLTSLTFWGQLRCKQVLQRSLIILYKVICNIAIIWLILVLSSLVAHIKTRLLFHNLSYLC